MKNVFGMKKDARETDGSVFIIRSVDEKLKETLEQNSEEAERLEKKASLPMPLSVVRIFAFFLFVIAAVSLIAAGTRGEPHNLPYVFALGGISGIIALALQIYKKIKEKKHEPEANILLEKMEAAEINSREQLHIPDTAAPTDFLSFVYKKKEGKIKIQTSLFADYVLVQTQAFFEDGKLCICDSNDVYGISVSEISGIAKRKKRIAAMGWNKMQAPTEKCFKKYGLTVNSYGVVYMKPYAMTIRRDDEEFELLIPPYEAEKICFFCGLSLPSGE